MQKRLAILLLTGLAAVCAPILLAESAAPGAPAAAPAVAAVAPVAAVPGQPAPAFTLKDIQGKTHTLADFKDQLVVLEWYNPDCPFVKKHYGPGNMQGLQKEFTAKGVKWLVINSSAEGKQGHCTPEIAESLIKEKGMAASAFLLDHDGTVGRAYGAKTTPHMFVIDGTGTLVYNGAIDDNPSPKPEDAKTAHNHVRAALEEALAGKAVTKASTQPYGCGVKYGDK
jgi:peroxiredoxin